MAAEPFSLPDLEKNLRGMHLPFQPHVLSTIIRLREDTRMNFNELDRMLRSDQNIASLILKVANSSFDSRGREIRTLPQAIGMIGFRTIISLVSAIEAKGIFKSGNYTRFQRYVGQHSFIVSVIARIIAERLNRPELAEEVFIGGLLHDIGKVVLNQIDRDKFISVIDRTLDEKISYKEAETELFGVDHALVGELIIKIWNLPGVYREIAVFHQSPQDPSLERLSEKDRQIIYIVGLANLLAKINNFGHCEVNCTEQLEQYYQVLGIPEGSEIRSVDWKNQVENDPYMALLP